MSGFENDVMVAKNLNFNEAGGKPHLGIINAAGLIPIGTGQVQPLQEIQAGTIVAGTGITVNYVSPNLVVASTASLTDLHVARFIVASSTAGTGANFTTIASAITAAQATGINSTIFIQPGTYTENLTLISGIDLCSFECDPFTPNVTIVGNHTFSTAGTVSISGIRLKGSGSALLTMAGNSVTKVNLIKCFLLGDTSLINFATTNASAALNIFDCNADINTNGIHFMDGSSTGTTTINNLYCTNTGGSSNASAIIAGSVIITNSMIKNGWVGTVTSGIQISNSIIDTSGAPGNSIGLHGSGTNIIRNSSIISGNSTAIAMNGTATVDCVEINTTAANSITGGGTLNYSLLSFTNTTSDMSVTTRVPNIVSNDAIKVVTPGAYPYTTTPTDALIKVDTSSARTITPLASPTTGQVHIIKDTVGSAAANNITVTPSGKNIDGAASSIINVNYGSITIVYNGSEWSIV